MCDNLCGSIDWDISQLPLSWDMCEASQLLHLKFSSTSNQEKIKIRPKAVSKDILGLEYLVDYSRTNDDDNHFEGNHGLEVPRDWKKFQKKVGRRSKMTEQTGNYPVDLIAGFHTVFVYCDLVKTKYSVIHKRHYSEPYRLVTTKVHNS